MKVVIAGGSGLLGTLYASARFAAGDEVVVLSRAPAPAPWRVAAWDARSLGAWAAECDGADVVANFAGRSVNCRYTAANRQAILASRVDSARAIGAAIARARRPPRVWLQASTATIYAHRYDAANDEFSGAIGGSEPGVPSSWSFSIDVARAWEQALTDAAAPHTRKAALRIAMVMDVGGGGAFDALLRLVRRGLGGAAGDGRQYVSWIHGADFVRSLDAIVADETMSGPVNVAAPEPLPYAAFMRELRRAARVPFGLPAPAGLVEIGTRLLGTESELVLKSRRVVAGKLDRAGFTYRFPRWCEAATELVRRADAAAAEKR